MISESSTDTGFDSSPLFIVKTELDNLLGQAEQAMSEYMEDNQSTEGLREVAANLGQSEGVLRLLNLEAASLLARGIADAFRQMAARPNATTDELLSILTQAIMLLKRYLEFVLLRAHPAPTVLLDVTNQLRQQLHQPLIGEGFYIDLAHASLPAPELTATTLSAADQQTLRVFMRRTFQAALHDALRNRTSDANLRMMRAVARQMKQLNGGDTMESYWQLVCAGLDHLPVNAELSVARKRTLIQVERLIASPDASIDGEMLQNVLSLALSQPNPLAAKLRSEWQDSGHVLSEQDSIQLRSQLFGPDRNAVDTISSLILAEIDQAKNSLDALARAETLPVVEDRPSFTEQLRQLGQTLFMLNMGEPAQGLLEESQAQSGWSVPPEASQVNSLMDRLQDAENAVILFRQQYTPGATSLPLNNMRISLNQLDGARQQLVQESLDTLTNVRSALEGFISSGGDMLHMENVPVMLESLTGALSFLQVERGSQLMRRAVRFLRDHFGADKPAPDVTVIESLADVLVAVQHYLEGIRDQKPVGQAPFVYGERSLQKLGYAA